MRLDNLEANSILVFCSITQTFSARMNDNLDEITEKISLPVIVYHPLYNVRFWGLERLHPLDSCKYRKIAGKLAEDASVTFLEPDQPIPDEHLRKVHDKQFLAQIYASKRTIVLTSEACVFYLLTRSSIQERLLKPLKYQVSGTLLACEEALKHGSAINLGGGFHHCSAVKSSGFCFFADITLAIHHVWSILGEDARILVLDCDAHQGNGYARDVIYRMNRKQRSRVYILDLYNPRIFPRDGPAKEAIDREVCLPWRVEDDEYLKLLKYHLQAVQSIDKFTPNFLIYNAGSDILANDPLGKLSITAEGLRKRDEMVFEHAANHEIPIAMLLSGGYSKQNWRPVADSILSLLKQNIVQSNY